MKKSYITPRVEVLTAKVERGYQCSGGYTTLTCGSEGMSNNGRIGFGSGEPWDNGSNVEGLGDAGTIFF